MPPTDPGRPPCVDGLAVAWYPHHVEHLAPWCTIMGMRIVLLDRPALRDAVGAYPDLAADWIPAARQPGNVPRLAHAVRARTPRAVFLSELFDREVLRSFFGGRDTAPRVVYVPHGFSEKRQDWARSTAFQDVAVLYGRHALEQLSGWGVADHLQRCVISGNVRAGYHRARAHHFRALVGRLGLDDPSGRRTLLYAPTWSDAIGSSSLFSALAPIASRVPAGWRLVVKLHPHSERHAAEVDRLEAALGAPGVRFVRNSPLTYPFLELADAYLGDMSSLAYDYLSYGRPMFFTNPTAGTASDAQGSRLFACGTVIPPDRYDDLWRIVDEAWDRDAQRFGEARAALDAYTHAPGRDVDALRKDMAGACAGPAPAWLTADAPATTGAA